MKQLLIATIAALALWTNVAHAAEPPWAFMGLGAGGCPDYAVNFEIPGAAENLLGFFSWAQGYMSGINNYIRPKKQLNGISEKSQKVVLYEYCVAYPDKKFGQAVMNLYNKLPDMPRE